MIYFLFSKLLLAFNHTSEVVRQAFLVELLSVGSSGLGETEFEFASPGVSLCV